MENTLKFMTFNIRVQSECDEINQFRLRKGRILNVIASEQPDIIGFQEVNDEMRQWLKSELKGYTVVGCGRKANYRGESVALAISDTRCDLISLEHYWMSPTPEIPGSRFEDQSQCPRITLAAKVVTDGNGRPFYVINTHLDHVGSAARYHGMMQNVQKISTLREKFVLMGDFNALPNAPEIKVISSELAYRGCRDITANIPTTFHNYGRNKEDAKIDYIFTDADTTENGYTVKDSGENGLYYSDHYAVCAEIKL